jgi:hypothetical protein
MSLCILRPDISNGRDAIVFNIKQHNKSSLETVIGLFYPEENSPVDT